MYWPFSLAILSIVVTVGAGFWLHWRPPQAGSPAVTRLKRSLAANFVVFFGSVAAALAVGLRGALAQEAGTEAVREVSIGLGLALIGAGLPTALACIGAGIAVGSVGAAALAVIAEKPEAFGRTLVFMGLAEGIAIYGLVVTILTLGKV